MGLKNNQGWEFDKDCDIVMLSSSCDLDWHVVTYHNEMSTHARSFNTTRSHAPLTRLARTHASLTRLARTPDNGGSIEKIIMLWPSCDFDRHIVMLSSSWLRQTNRLRHSHAIYRHIVMLSSSCEFDRHIVILSSYCEFYRNIVMLSSSCELDTSPCYQNEKSTNARAPAL